MKITLINSLLLLIGLFLFSQDSYAQSISGNIKDFSSTESLSYATVDIYKGSTLVASVLADKNGDFNVKLDTGFYRCEILYAGYHKIAQEFKVTDDEKATFNLKEDKDSEYSKDVDEEVGISRGYYDGRGDASSEPAEEISLHYSSDAESGSYRGHKKAMSVSKVMTRPLVPDSDDYPQVGSGMLTAGEVNDFSKWTMWTDLAEGDLKSFQSIWNLAPSHRYMVEVMNKNGVPIANAKVELLDDANNVIFKSRTDNTGKAECWAQVEEQGKSSDKHSIRISYDGQVKTIKKAKEFGSGNNRLELNVDCDQSQIVDIAFVVDATGSMGDELEFLKAELNDVIYKAKAISSQLNFRFANVFYRDHGDAYLTRSMDFSRVLSESVSFISRQRADGGGDFPEAVDNALDTAIRTLNWSDDARTRLLFLVLDAPPHQSPEINAKLLKATKLAAEKGIRIIPMTASGIDKSTEYLMRSMALISNGTYTFLTNHSGIGGNHIEPSTDEYEVEKLNDLMVRLIKSFTYMPDCDQQMPELELPFSDSVVVVPSTQDSSATIDSAKLDSKVLSWKYYPNPTRGIVNIVANVAITELHITDLSGKILQRITDIDPEVPVQADLFGYTSGIYLIRYPVGQQWVSGKIILMR